MKGLLYCYHGEKDGKKKVAVPKVKAGAGGTGEYDIYTLEIEKNEDDVRGQYVLIHDIDAVYNRRDFNTKKYKFNSFNIKDPYTFNRTHRIIIMELENKTSVSFGSRIVEEEYLGVEDGRFLEVSRNYVFNDSYAYASKVISKYVNKLKEQGDSYLSDIAEGKVEGPNASWEDELLTIEDLGIEDADVEFLGQAVHSSGSSKLLGYANNLGVIAYEDGEAENYVYEILKRKGEDPILGVVINKDLVRVMVNESVYTIPKEQEKNWKEGISKLVSKFVPEFKVKNTIILQQIKEIKNDSGEVQKIFRYVLRKDTIYAK